MTHRTLPSSDVRTPHWYAATSPSGATTASAICSHDSHVQAARMDFRHRFSPPAQRIIWSSQAWVATGDSSGWGMLPHANVVGRSERVGHRRRA